MRRLGLIAAGGLLPASFAPFDVWPAAFVGVGLAFWLLQDVRDWRTGFFYGWLIGVGKYAIGASWIYVSIHEQGGASESLASVMVVLFVAGMALFSALFGVLYSLCAPALKQHGSAVLSAAVFAATWCVAEWSLTWLLTGFPWLFVGYGLMPTWLAGFAPVVGVLGLSFLACLIAGLAVVAWSGSAAWRATTFGCVLGLFLAGFGLSKVSWVSLGASGDVALVQGNIEQITKWDPANRLPILDTYERLTEPHWGAELIVWPEAALTLFAEQATPWLDRWEARGRASGSTLVLGLPDVKQMIGLPADGVEQRSEDDAFQNTAVAVGAGAGRYVKQRLVPFGEYVPLEVLLRGVIRFFDLPMSRSSAGPADQPPMLIQTSAGSQGALIGLAICYEIAYPELVRASAANSDVLVTISNDAWFGASIGPHQHLQLARMRALENGRYVLRSTNNGVTAIINERGEVTASLPQFESGVLRGSYALVSGRTPFTRLGHWPLLALLVVILGIGLVRRRWYIAAPLQ